MEIFDRNEIKSSNTASSLSNKKATAFFEWLSKLKIPGANSISFEDKNIYLSVLLTAPLQLKLPKRVKERIIEHNIYSSSDPKNDIVAIRSASNFQIIDKRYSYALSKALFYFEKFINESKSSDLIKVVPKRTEKLSEPAPAVNETDIVREFEKWLTIQINNITIAKEIIKTLYTAPMELNCSTIVDRKVFRKTDPNEIQEIVKELKQAKNFNQINSIYFNQLSSGLDLYQQFLAERACQPSVSKTVVEDTKTTPVADFQQSSYTAIPTVDVSVSEASLEKQILDHTSKISRTERANDFQYWLINNQGLTEKQAKSVVTTLYTKPFELRLSLTTTERNILACSNTLEFDSLIHKFATAKNWQILSEKNDGRFLKCLRAYERFLRNKSDNQSAIDSSILSEGIKSQSHKPDFIPAYLTPPLIPKRNDPLINELKPILEERFKNGIYYEKPVDLKKLKRYYTEAKGSEIPDSKDLSNIIKRCGFEVGNKVYFITDEGRRELEDVIDNILEQGFRYIDYTAFRDVQYELCERLYIYDDNVLKHIFSKIRPKLNYTTTAFTVTTSDRIIDELERIFTDNYVLSLDEMYRMLPYIEHDSIYASLNRVSQFINNSTGCFTHIDKIYLDETECKAIAEFVRKEVSEHAFCNLRNLEMPVSNELSGGISDSAIKKKFYMVYLEKDFEESSLLITKNGANKKDIFKNIIESRDRITYEEIRQLQEDVLGERTNNLYVFYAKDFLVRVSEELYLKDLTFDTERADFAIQQFMSGDSVELREITSFTSFPDVGYPWNEYLLESYVKRFSNVFELDGKSTVRVKKDVRIHA
jgi:hypothetical protein